MDEVIELTSGDYSGHDFSHVERVMNIAALLQKSEGGDLFIISLASLLHDVDDIKLSPETHKFNTNAYNILNKYCVSKPDIEKIIGIIECVSFSKGKTPETIEGKIVQDADRIDALGAIGIARCFSYGGNNKLPIYSSIDFSDSADNSKSSLMHFYNKLLKLHLFMNTNKGKEIAEKRTLFIKLYLQQFLDEIFDTDINIFGG